MKRLLLGLIVLCSGLFSAVPAFSACTLTCPANITASNDANQCGAVVNYPAPTTTGSCGTITCAPASGSFFPVGTVPVTCSEATVFCSFSVTVNDVQPPSITCPANIFENATGPEVVNFSPPTTSDNCPGVTSICTPPSGSTFPLGQTIDTCTSTDASGNTATCTYTINLVDVELSVSKSDTPDPVLPGGDITYTISVTNNGPDDAVDLILTDTLPANTTFVSFTAPAGYTLTTPPFGGTGTVTANNPNVVAGVTDDFTLVVQVNPGTPDGTVLSNTADVTSLIPDSNIGNNSSTTTTSVTLPRITIDDVTVTEGDSGTVDACFTVTLSTPSTDIVTVDLATADDTAAAPDDYISTSSPVSFPIGETSSEVCVTVNSDLMGESDETFFVNLSNATNAVIGDSQGIGIILDDDAATGEIAGGGCILAENSTGNNPGSPIFALFLVFLTTGTLAARRLLHSERTTDY